MAQRPSQRAWYERNRERVLAAAETYRQEHAAEIAAYMREYRKRSPRTDYKRAWRESHPESGAQAKKVWTAQHRDLNRQRSRDWALAHPDRMRDHDRRRRAMVRDLTVEVFSEAEIYARDGWRCRLCGGRVSPTRRFPNPLSPTLDHIVSIRRGGPHSRANVQLAHFVCNQRKGSA